MFEQVPRGSIDPLAGDQLLLFLYHEIRAVARRHLAGERPGHTLSPTALINELYLRLASGGQSFPSEAAFLSAASNMMRNLLVDHARSRRAAKRGGDRQRIDLDQIRFEVTEGHSLNAEAMDEALTALATIGERQARVVELRFFGGLSGDEIAAELCISAKTVKRDWALAREWLRTWIGEHRR